MLRYELACHHLVGSHRGLSDAGPHASAGLEP